MNWSGQPRTKMHGGRVGEKDILPTLVGHPVDRRHLLTEPTRLLDWLVCSPCPISIPHPSTPALVSPFSRWSFEARSPSWDILSVLFPWCS